MADLECQDLAAVARELEEQMRNVGGGNFISEEGSVQLDMTKEIVVTVTGCGVVTIWSRKTMLPLYRNHHHIPGAKSNGSCRDKRIPRCPKVPPQRLLWWARSEADLIALTTNHTQRRI